MQGQKLNSEQKDEGQLSSSPNNSNTPVIGSQSPPNPFTAIDLLNAVSDAVFAYRIKGEKPYSIVTNFEFPIDT